jgi:nucleotide-binding universal stress UspA family protein
MSDVVLIVPGRPELRDNLMAAARNLSDLIGGARVVELAPPVLAGAAASSIAVQAHASHTPDFAGEVAARGCRADFLVATQPDATDTKFLQLAFRAAVFRTGRPVLMMPAHYRGDFGHRVAIAWRDDARTVKALMPAMKLLGYADEVHLLAGTRAGAPTPALPSVLLEHGIKATLHVLAIGIGPFGEQLLNRACDVSADLLIMGAHGHTRLHDILLGGVTNYVVNHTNVPVLMRN